MTEESFDNHVDVNFKGQYLDKPIITGHKASLRSGTNPAQRQLGIRTEVSVHASGCRLVHEGILIDPACRTSHRSMRPHAAKE